MAAGIGLLGPVGDVLAKSLKATKKFDSLVDGASMTTDDALDAAIDVLGDNPQNIADGVFRSADGTKQVRMTDQDLSDSRGAHMNFERGKEVETANGRTTFEVDENKHIFLPEER